MACLWLTLHYYCCYLLLFELVISRALCLPTHKDMLLVEFRLLSWLSFYTVVFGTFITNDFHFCIRYSLVLTAHFHIRSYRLIVEIKLF